MSRLVQQSVAGVIIIAPVASRDSALGALPAELPAVVVEADPESAASAVTVDSQLGAALATRHLLELGHRTVFHISGPRDWIEAQQRIVGWRDALEHAGAPIPEVILGDWSAQAGYDAGLVLAKLPDATAVFAANDNMALGLLRALSEQGRSVPGDISVVGFDDIAEAGFFTPADHDPPGLRGDGPAHRRAVAAPGRDRCAQRRAHHVGPGPGGARVHSDSTPAAFSEAYN